MTDLQAVLFVVVWCAAIWGCVYSWYRIFASIKRDIKGVTDGYDPGAPRQQYPRAIGRVVARGPARIEGRLAATRRAEEAGAVSQLGSQQKQQKNHSRDAYPAEVADADSGGNAA